MSLNEDLVLTIELDNQEEIERTMDDLQKKVSKTKSKDSSNTQNKALAKTVTLNKEMTGILDDISHYNNDQLRLVDARRKEVEREVKILNKHMSVVGDIGQEWVVARNAETGFYERLLKDKKDVNSESDREGMKLDKLIRKYRWLQSFLLVTQNFIGMMGKSVKAFGAGMKLLIAPFVLFLNLLLIPFLPSLERLSKWIMDIVLGYKDWSEENETLAAIIGGVVFTSILGILGLALVAWFVGVVSSIGPFLVGLGGLVTTIGGTAVAGSLIAGLTVLAGALVGLGIGVLVVNLLKAVGVFDKLSDATQGWRTSLKETEETARLIWINDSFLTNAIQGIGDFVNVITGDTVLTRSLANKNLAKTMTGEGGYSEGLDKIMMGGLYGPNVLRSPEGVGGYINDRTGQLITKIDESSYNIYIQNKDKSWYEIQSEIKSQKAIEGGVYS